MPWISRKGLPIGRSHEQIIMFGITGGLSVPSSLFDFADLLQVKKATLASHCGGIQFRTRATLVATGSTQHGVCNMLSAASRLRGVAGVAPNSQRIPARDCCLHGYHGWRGLSHH